MKRRDVPVVPSTMVYVGSMADQWNASQEVVQIVLNHVDIAGLMEVVRNVKRVLCVKPLQYRMDYAGHMVVGSDVSSNIAIGKHTKEQRTIAITILVYSKRRKRKL